MWNLKEVNVTAKIITLPNARRSRVVCPETDVVFPQLYRLTGNEWALKEGVEPKGGLINLDEDLVPTDRKITPAYTLENGYSYSHIANPAWEPIYSLDPEIDSGWVIIRHHSTRSALDAYIDAMFDMETHESPFDRWRSFETQFGLFSLVHRRASRNTPDHLVIYVTKIPDPSMTVADWQYVVAPGGDVLDPDLLFPADELEQRKSLIDILNDR